MRLTLDQRAVLSRLATLCNERLPVSMKNPFTDKVIAKAGKLVPKKAIEELILCMFPDETEGMTGDGPDNKKAKSKEADYAWKRATGGMIRLKNPPTH